MKRPYVIVSVLLLLVAGGLYSFARLRAKLIHDYLAAAALKPVVVDIARVETSQWDNSVDTIGSLVAVQGIDVASEVSGVIKILAFTPGTSVESGQLLVQLVADVEAVTLQDANARLELAQSNATRLADLQQGQIASRASYEQALAQLADARSNVERSQLALERKSIRAPFTGTIGISRVGVGQYINPGAIIASLEDIGKLYVNFSLPEDKLGQLTRGMPVEIGSTAFPSRVFNGVLTALDARLDAATRMLKMQVSLINPDGALRPGMSATVRIPLKASADLVVIPQTAIAYNLWGDSVFVVRDSAEAATSGAFSVEQRVVTVAGRRNDLALISSGLRNGERIVIAGYDNLTIDTKVVDAHTLRAPTPK